TDSPSPDPDSDPDNRQSPDPSIASVASVASISEIHSIRSIPAMPLDRIAGALNRVIADIMRHRAQWQRRSPERQTASSPDHSPSVSTSCAPCLSGSQLSGPGDQDPTRPSPHNTS
ncbi:hypothetical protein LLG95_16595, partial [bacterium]|nr:hypothetical protein [bacterium]